MKLYHGSNVPVNVPDLKHSKPYKDFGRGFYLSADRKQAVEMGEQKLSQIKQGSVYVSTFLFDESVMTSGKLKVKIFNGKVNVKIVMKKKLFIIRKLNLLFYQKL